MLGSLLQATPKTPFFTFITTFNIIMRTTTQILLYKKTYYNTNLFANYGVQETNNNKSQLTKNIQNTLHLCFTRFSKNVD